MSLHTTYTKEMLPKLQKELGIGNVNAAPHVKMVVVHVGVGKRSKESNFTERVADTLRRITGQKPVNTLAKQSISNFKVRKGSVIGLKVTLRGARMFDFLEKLISVTLPRVTDFRGISKKLIDSQGNLHIGFKDHVPFPEVNPEDVGDAHGIQVSIITTASSKQRGEKLFELMGFPFKTDEHKK